MKVCVLCSTFHFAKYLDGRLRWFVKDEIVKSQIKPMRLINVDIETSEEFENLSKIA